MLGRPATSASIERIHQLAAMLSGGAELPQAQRGGRFRRPVEVHDGEVVVPQPEEGAVDVVPKERVAAMRGRRRLGPAGLALAAASIEGQRNQVAPGAMSDDDGIDAEVQQQVAQNESTTRRRVESVTSPELSVRQREMNRRRLTAGEEPMDFQQEGLDPRQQDINRRRDEMGLPPLRWNTRQTVTKEQSDAAMAEAMRQGEQSRAERAAMSPEERAELEADQNQGRRRLAEDRMRAIERRRQILSGMGVETEGAPELPDNVDVETLRNVGEIDRQLGENILFQRGQQRARDRQFSRRARESGMNPEQLRQVEFERGLQQQGVDIERLKTMTQQTGISPDELLKGEAQIRQAAIRSNLSPQETQAQVDAYRASFAQPSAAGVAATNDEITGADAVRALTGTGADRGDGTADSGLIGKVTAIPMNPMELQTWQDNMRHFERRLDNVMKLPADTRSMVLSEMLETLTESWRGPGAIRSIAGAVGGPFGWMDVMKSKSIHRKQREIISKVEKALENAPKDESPETPATPTRRRERAATGNPFENRDNRVGVPGSVM